MLPKPAFSVCSAVAVSSDKASEVRKRGDFVSSRTEINSLPAAFCTVLQSSWIRLTSENRPETTEERNQRVQVTDKGDWVMYLGRLPTPKTCLFWIALVNSPSVPCSDSNENKATIQYNTHWGGDFASLWKINRLVSQQGWVLAGTLDCFGSPVWSLRIPWELS